MPVCAPPLQAVAAALRGVEPLQPGPKPGVLPLDDRAMWYCAPVAGFEPTTRRLTAGCSATELYGKGVRLGNGVGPCPSRVAKAGGFEPPSGGFGDRCFAS